MFNGAVRKVYRGERRCGEEKGESEIEHFGTLLYSGLYGQVFRDLIFIVPDQS